VTPRNRALRMQHVALPRSPVPACSGQGALPAGD
jgi:hypothetical protein